MPSGIIEKVAQFFFSNLQVSSGSNLKPVNKQLATCLPQKIKSSVPRPIKEKEKNFKACLPKRMKESEEEIPYVKIKHISIIHTPESYEDFLKKNPSFNKDNISYQLYRRTEFSREKHAHRLNEADSFLRVRLEEALNPSEGEWFNVDLVMAFYARINIEIAHSYKEYWEHIHYRSIPNEELINILQRDGILFTESIEEINQLIFFVQELNPLYAYYKAKERKELFVTENVRKYTSKSNPDEYTEHNLGGNSSQPNTNEYTGGNSDRWAPKDTFEADFARDWSFAKGYENSSTYNDKDGDCGYETGAGT